MRIENAEMRVIKWKRAQNDDRKRKMEKMREKEREQSMIHVVITS